MQPFGGSARLVNPLAPSGSALTASHSSTSDPKAGERDSQIYLADADSVSTAGRLIGSRPFLAMAATGCCMFGLAVLGQLLVPLQFDTSVDGFTPRGTPMATRVNTGLLLQQDDQGLQAYPKANCASPPVEMWLVLCSSTASSGSNSSTSLAIAACQQLGGDSHACQQLFAALTSDCNPMCVQAVAPWLRECQRRTGSSVEMLAYTVAEAVVEKLPASVTSSYSGSLSYTTALISLSCASGFPSASREAVLEKTSSCMLRLVLACDAAFQSSLDVANAHNNASSGNHSIGGSSTMLGPFCQAKDAGGKSLNTLTLNVFYAGRGWEQVVNERKRWVDVDLGNILTANALHEICTFEKAVMDYASAANYCQRQSLDSWAPCCPPKSISTMVSFLFDKPCGMISDHDLVSLVTLLRLCDSARAEACFPRWAGMQCNTTNNCIALDPSCHVGVVTCDAGYCVDRCTIPESGMVAPLRGPVAEGLLKESIQKDFFYHLMYRFLDRDFSTTGKSTFSSANFPFVNSLKRKQNQDISMVKSKHQLLPLYNEVLLPWAEDRDAAVLKVAHEGVLQMDIIQQQLISDILHVILAVGVVFITIWAHIGSLFITFAGMVHVLMAFPSAYSFYTVVLGLRWMPLLNYIGIFVAIGIGADDIFVYADAWSQASIMLPSHCSLEARISWTIRRAGSAIFLTSFTTSAAFLTNIVNDVVPMQLFGIFMSLMVAFDYLYTVTWFPCAVAVYHVHIEHNPRCPGATRFCRRLLHLVCVRRARFGVATTTDELGTPVTSGTNLTGELRWLERKFRDNLSPLINKWRVIIICLTIFLTVPMTFFMLSLELDEGGIQPFPLGHNQRQFMDIDAAHVLAQPPGYHDRGMTVQIVMGVEATDTGSRFDKDDHGTLHFDPSFDLDSPEAQSWILSTAKLTRSKPFFAPHAYQGFARVTSAQGATQILTAEGGIAGDCETSALFAFDSEAASSWMVTPCEAATLGNIVTLEITLLEDIDKINECIAHPNFCVLLRPKLIGRVDLLWTVGRSPTSYSLEAAVRPGNWTTFANVSGLDPDRDNTADSIAIDWKPVSFLRLSFPIEAERTSVALAEMAIHGDEPTVFDLVDIASRILPPDIPCGGGLPLPHPYSSGGAGGFTACAGLLARLITDGSTGDIKGFGGGLLFKTAVETGPPDKLVGAAMQFSTTVKQGLVESWQFSKMYPNYHSWDTWVKEQLALAPPSCSTAWVVGLGYLATDTQLALQAASLQSGLLALLLAFCVIFAATRSLSMSLLSTGAIATILCWVMGIIVLKGWKLGLMESTNIAILIGVSVDFVIHFAHAYMHMPNGYAGNDDGDTACQLRKAKTAYSLTTMGISVIAAAVTTLFSAGVLSMCTLTFFDKFGVFLCVTMLTAVSLSTTFFQALLGQFGPLTSSTST